jgi:phosphoribosylanthranilate isomerase
MIIKVCGMTDSDNISQVAALGVDWIGMIFWPKSPRYVKQINVNAGIIPDRGNLTKNKNNIQRVGVFVNDMMQNVVTRIVNYQLDMVQLHGNETPTYIQNLKATVLSGIQPKLKIIKAISVTTVADIDLYKDYEDCVDYFVFDTKCPSVGGSGQQFDWDLLQRYKGSKPFLLSGGIGPENAKQVKAFHHPQCIGIDLNSKFEISPGIKNVEALRQFIEQIM